MKATYLLIYIFVIAVLGKSCSQSSATANQVIDSIITYQPVTPVLIGKENNPVLQIRIDVSSSDSSQVLTRISISTQGTTNLNDIQEVRVLRTEDFDTYSTKAQFGETNGAKEIVILEGNLPLVKGANYFWVSYKLKSDADLLNKVQATCLSVSINGKELTPVRTKSPGPNRVGHALRKSGDDGVDTYRIPGLVTTNEGTLIAVYDIRKNSSVDLQEDIDIGMNRSTDGGQTWEPMMVIMDMGEWGGKPQIENGIGDPSVLVDRQSNTIWVAGIWAHGHPGKRNWFASRPGIDPTETSQLMLVKSEDEGITWSDPINITLQIKDPEWHLLLQGPGKGITLKNGTLVFPAQFKDENQVPYSTLIFSTDHGQTWNIGKGVRKETTEAQVVELADGSIMINARNNEARDKQGIGRVVATTDDYGQTWKEHSSSISALEESTCMGSLVIGTFNKYGSVLLFSNPNTHTGRFNMMIKLSVDQGLTWPEENWLLLDEGHGYGYSCMNIIDEETIGILYEGSQAHMVFQKVKVEEIVSE